MRRTHSKSLLSASLLISCLWVAMASLNLRAASPAWLTDLESAKAIAARDKKLILADFTGSDWCGWCMKLKSEVFDQPGFQAYANQNLVLLEVDFPRGKTLPAALTEANQALAQRFKVQGFPTLIILNPQGVEVGRTGYQPGGPTGLINQLRSLHTQTFGTGPKADGPGAITRSQPKEKEKEEGIFGWFHRSKTPAPAGETLKLKGLSGIGNNRLALINTESLKVGDDARIQLGDRSVRVHCVEIKERSVMVKLDSNPEVKELELGK